MYRDKISLDVARKLQSEGHVIIIDASPESLQPLGTEGKVWKDNFKALQRQHRDISPDKLLAFVGATYCIEVPLDSDFTWRYLYGLQSNSQ